MHERTIVVWDVPSATEGDSRFRVRVGVRCSAGCPADGWRVTVVDADGRSQAETMLGGAPWPGTAALYHTEVEVSAPAAEGLHAFRVTVPAVDAIPGDDTRPDHGPAEAAFNVRVVRPSECTLKVIAIDQARRVPVPGARVVVHPYRAVTDNEGVAVLRVPKGAYRLFVSGRDYLPFRAEGELRGDGTVEAELYVDRGPSDAELWS